MADALVSIVLDQLASTIRQQVEEEMKLVVGVDKEVAKLTSNLKAIQAVLYDAEKKQVNDATVRDWLDKLKDVTYDIDDTVDEWSTAIDLKFQIEGVENASIPKKKVCFSPCFCFRQVSLRRDIALKIKDLNERLDVIAKEKETYNFSPKSGIEKLERPKTTSFIDVAKVQGRDKDKKTVVDQLLDDSSEQKSNLHIISIVGSGGMGKTTLAQLAYNDKDVKDHFHKRIWVCVSDPFDEIRVAKAILEQLGVRCQELVELQTLLQHIQDSIKEHKFLLVLDDVWIKDDKKWESFELSLNSGARGSRILVTTRNETVAMIMHTTYTHHLEQLSRDDCWFLFSHIAFFGKKGEDRENFEEIGRALVEKCKGLPLAAKSLGSLMFVKESIEEWRNVLESEIWSQKVVGEELSPVLLLSYYDLPAAIKRCFSYCAVFPKDTEIGRNNLIQLWMAQGYLGSNKNAEMEITGKEYFMNLAVRSFFQEFVKDEDDGSIIGCKMHDIVHDVAQFVTKNECSIMKVGGVNANAGGMESCCTKAHHSTLTIEAEVSSPISICTARNLRTLLVQRRSSRFPSSITDFISHLTCVRALNLNGCSGKEVPMEIGKLIHLRYLNLSYNDDLERLPETVCDLYNLQTLNLAWCKSLEKLPQGMGKLINLRHLFTLGCWRVKEIPKGIGRLSCLRTLERFIVSGGKDCCKLGDLEGLNHLRVLRIEGLENVEDGGEAEKAKLKNKKHLQELGLYFKSPGEKQRRVCEDGRMMDNDVLEALQLPPHLELLRINAFSGASVSPKFILTLTKLRKLQFFDFNKCECLPPLGKLPFLESLVISIMNDLKIVGVEFLGISLDDSDTPIVAFPKLKHLGFGFMPQWEEWVVPASASRRVTLMPLLLSLDLYRCDKLKALPNYLSQMTNLERLKIIDSHILRQRYEKGTGEDWHKISHIPTIII